MTARSIAAFCLLASLPAIASAETVEVTPDDDLAAVLAELQPGDELVLGGGTYDVGGAGLTAALNGSADSRIVVRGDAGDTAVITSTSDDFTLAVTGSNVTISDLELRGPGTALSLTGTSLFTRDVLITDARVGIDCRSCEVVAIVDTEFANIGVGGQGAAIQSGSFVAGVIAHNWIHDFSDGADGISITQNSWESEIVDNVIEGAPSTGIRTGFPTDSADATVEHLIAGNWISGSGDGGIVANGRASIVNNIVTDFGGTGIWATVETPGDLGDFIVAHNTVVQQDGTCFRATDWALSVASSALANNALYCPGGTAMQFDSGGGTATVVTSNVYLGVADTPGDSFVGESIDADFEAAADGNFYPAAMSPLLESGLGAWIVTPDFNGVDRLDPPDVGAYERSDAMNPFPQPGGGFKPEGADGAPGADGGVPQPGVDFGPPPPSNNSGRATGGAVGDFPERDDGCDCGSGGGTALFILPVLLAARLRRRR